MIQALKGSPKIHTPMIRVDMGPIMPIWEVKAGPMRSMAIMTIKTGKAVQATAARPSLRRMCSAWISAVNDPKMATTTEKATNPAFHSAVNGRTPHGVFLWRVEDQSDWELPGDRSVSGFHQRVNATGPLPLENANAGLGAQAPSGR